MLVLLFVSNSDFDQLILNIMDEASDCSSMRIQSLIRRPIKMFDEMSCLKIADLSNNRKFISHKAVTLVVDQFWNGIVNPEVATLRVYTKY